MAAAGGEPQRLTSSKTDVGSFKWSPDGTTIAFTAIDPPTADEEKASREKNDAQVVDQNVKLNRLYLVSIVPDADGQRAPRLLTGGDSNVGNDDAQGDHFDWSPDGTNIVFCRAPSPDWRESPKLAISVVDVISGEIKALTHSATLAVAPLYSPDGRWIACLVSRDKWGNAGLDVTIFPATGGTARKLAETPELRPTLVGWSHDGQRIYCTERDRTVTRLLARSLSGGAVEIISQRAATLSAAVTLNFTRTAVGFYAQSLTRPVEAFVSQLDRFSPVQVTLNASKRHRSGLAFRTSSVSRSTIPTWPTCSAGNFGTSPRLIFRMHPSFI